MSRDPRPLTEGLRIFAEEIGNGGIVMGYNTVAILLNDHLDVGAKDPKLGEKIKRASLGWHGRDRDRYALDISAASGNCIGSSYGSIISQDHADGYQVVVVHGNFGWRIDQADHDKYLGWHAIDQMKDCLERNGYRVTKSRKPKAEPSP